MRLYIGGIWLFQQTLEGQGAGFYMSCQNQAPEHEKQQSNQQIQARYDEETSKVGRQSEELQQKVEHLERDLVKSDAKIKEIERMYENDRKKWQNEKKKLEGQSRIPVAEGKQNSTEVKRCNALTAQVDSLKNEKSKLEEQNRMQVAEGKKKLDEVSQKCNTLHAKLDSLKKTQDQREKEIKEEHERKLEKMKLEYEKLQETKQGLVKDKNTSLKESEILKKQYQDQMEKMEKEHEKKEEELKKAYGEKIQEIRDRFDEKVSTLTTEHDEDTREMKENEEKMKIRYQEEIEAIRREIREEYEEKFRCIKAGKEKELPDKEWIVPENIYDDDRLQGILHEIMDKVDSSISIRPLASSSINLSHCGRVLLPVIVPIGLVSDLQTAMEKAKLGSVPAIVLVYHHLAPHNSKITTKTKDRLSDRELVERGQDMIDLVFWKGSMYDCAANQNALTQLKAIAKETFKVPVSEQVEP